MRSNRPDGVYELLDQIGKCLPLHLYNVTQVELAASVTVDADKPPSGNDPHHASQLLFAQVRRTGPEAARHVECLGD